MFEPGENVTYVTKHKTEHGRVKSISDDSHVFVVYNCGCDWKNYTDYIAARTRNEGLRPGWVITPLI